MSDKKIKKAFILAAGFGLRLRPLTDSMPKALVLYKGRPMIENVIDKLTSYGIDEIYINTHHLAEKMNEYFSQRTGMGNITLIHESQILGTGGAIMNASRNLSDADDILIYNTDVDCNLDIGNFFEFHLKNRGIATLCVQRRATSRYLLCSSSGKLEGRTENGENIIYTLHKGEILERAFCGIHIINKRIFDVLGQNDQNFEIIPAYMNIIKNNENIYTYDITEIYWKDLGIPQNL
ncbi:MAG: nucleotidyltransferase family protein [Ignavibacteria bacterium]|nr:nucleotidyltransferase family protein [Ignavibacteria bacterium]